MNELEAKCYLVKQGSANNSDHDFTHCSKRGTHPLLTDGKFDF